MKSTILLTIALFLISAPAPDANDIAEMTANFIVPEQLPGLEAAEALQPDMNSIEAPDQTNKTLDTSDGEALSAEEFSDSAAKSVQTIKDKMQNRPANKG